MVNLRNKRIENVHLFRFLALSWQRVYHQIGLKPSQAAKPSRQGAEILAESRFASDLNQGKGPRNLATRFPLAHVAQRTVFETLGW